MKEGAKAHSIGFPASNHENDPHSACRNRTVCPSQSSQVTEFPGEWYNQDKTNFMPVKQEVQIISSMFVVTSC